MRRGRGKGRKLSVSNNEDSLSGEEEKIPVQKKRGRPQKQPKEEIDEGESEMIKMDDEEEDMIGNETTLENGKKQKNPISRENLENGNEERLNKRNNGFRQSGSRRKSTPRRAAEAVFEFCSFSAD